MLEDNISRRRLHCRLHPRMWKWLPFRMSWCSRHRLRGGRCNNVYTWYLGRLGRDARLNRNRRHLNRDTLLRWRLWRDNMYYVWRSRYAAAFSAVLPTAFSASSPTSLCASSPTAFSASFTTTSPAAAAGPVGELSWLSLLVWPRSTTRRPAIGGGPT